MLGRLVIYHYNMVYLQSARLFRKYNIFKPNFVLGKVAIDMLNNIDGIQTGVLLHPTYTSTEDIKSEILSFS